MNSNGFLGAPMTTYSEGTQLCKIGKRCVRILRNTGARRRECPDQIDAPFAMRTYVHTYVYKPCIKVYDSI